MTGKYNKNPCQKSCMKEKKQELRKRIAQPMMTCLIVLSNMVLYLHVSVVIEDSLDIASNHLLMHAKVK